MIRHREIPSFVYDPSCVLYLPLRKRDGGSFISDDAYGHLATVTGATWGLQGRTFDGTDDKITMPQSAALDDISAVISILAWCRADTISPVYYPIVGKRLSGTDDLFQLQFDDDTSPYQIQFGIWIGNSAKLLFAATTLVANQWYQIAAVYDGATQTVYVNGLFSASRAQTGNIDTSSSVPLLIGNEGYTGWFDGTIGEVLIYNRALTALEVQQNYQVTKWRYQ